MTDPHTSVPPSAPLRGWRDHLAEALPSWSPGRLLVVAVGAVAAAVTLAFLVVRPGQPPAPLVLPPAAGVADPAVPEPGAPSAPGATTEEAPDRGPLTVHAAGAVAHPGVYGVRTGARVADVVTVAGGPSGEADLDRLNLAAPVSDGERVWVPRRGEAGEEPALSAGPGGGPAAGGSTGTAQPLVDINRASAQELDALPGVGPATAAAIVAWRQANGRFRSVAALLEVRGIGPAKFEVLRPLVRV